MKTSTIPTFIVLVCLVVNLYSTETMAGESPPAAGPVFSYAAGDLDSLILAHLSAINRDSIRNTMLQMQNLGTRFMLAPNRKEVALWMQDRFESVGLETTAIDSFQTHTMITVNNVYYDTVTWQYNVSAILPGHKNPDKITLIGGHYDCFTNNDPMNVAPGADDNASSVATIIELARVIINSGYQHNKTIRFLALGAEELMNFSTVSGARDYADRCAENGEDVQLYINNDMIANEPEPDGWIIDYIVHDLEYWTCPLTTDLAATYTTLTTNVMYAGNFGADDLPFWQAGFQTGYFFEHNFCPYYHTEDDVVDNCNMDYCTEVARLNMALLLSVTERPEPVDRFFLFATGEGGSLQARWNPLDENDIEGYEIRFGTSPDALDEVHITSDTAWSFSGLQEGSLYYASISAINATGNMSEPVIRKARPASATLDQGILVVAGSAGGLLDPPQEEIDLFYEGICHNFLFETMDATGSDELLLEEIGKYSTVLWHIDDPDLNSTLLADHSDVLRNYLWLGGNFMFTGFKPARMFGANETPAFFREGSFPYDCLGIAESYNQSSRLFSGGQPELPGWPEVRVDSLKIPIFNYHLPWVEVFTPAAHGETLYRYDTKYDTATNQGSYYGLPVGVVPAGGQKQAVTLGFPLYYMDSLGARELVYRVMTELFGEEYLGFEDHVAGNSLLVRPCPNPATTEVTFRTASAPGRLQSVHILDASGKEVADLDADAVGPLTWNAELFPAGIYLFRAVFDTGTASGKIVLRK